MKKEKKRKAIINMRFSQGRYSPAGSGNAVITLSCEHENIRPWNKRPKGYEMKCDFCPDDQSDSLHSDTFCKE